MTNADQHQKDRDRNQRLYQIALTMIPQVGAVTARTLLSYCGSPEAVFFSPRKNLMKIPNIGPALTEQIKNHRILEEAEKEMEYLNKHKIKSLFFTDSDYPRRLRHLPDAPILLYVKGDASLNSAKTAAIIGTRSPSDYGRAMTDLIVQGLKAFDVHIVSGLAYGIDIRAHRACLNQRVTTTGVLGSGFRNVYPSTHIPVAHQMTANGNLVTEFSSMTKPTRENFPMRNRIIAGLSDAVIVVETANRGGSIITAELAIGYHKDVFAIPGAATSPRSQGCNRLIKLHKAALVENAEDVAYQMGWDQDKANNQSYQQQLPLDLPEQEARLLEVMAAHPASSLDFLAYQLNTSPGRLSEHLLQLEIKGHVKCMPGNRYLAAHCR